MYPSETTLEELVNLIGCNTIIEVKSIDRDFAYKGYSRDISKHEEYRAYLICEVVCINHTEEGIVITI